MPNNNPGNLEKRKAELIRNFISLTEGKKNEDMLPLLLAVSTKAKREGISFSPEETRSIINTIKEDMSAEDKAKIDLFMNMMNNFQS